ncbi:efflux RND transporter periplasmic adaptor subunit [Priestia endophytica]|uniref:efflux RND transporter periplasmic adaptor subunit n=1 Tax=Priestia endophytica TaxID=135735 RepID=UPI00227DA50C|nr:efflux RND transporter periplasmic adaptor subunit [Priestia endophytica]MCY8235211.1 efflux RND transporter periplasmic adaptor subunit [Priestia endophytica]
MKKWIIGSVLVATVGGGSWFFLHNEEQPQMATASVQTSTVRKGDLEVNVTGSGSVTTITDQDVTAANTLLGVKSVSVVSGESVSKGDTLLIFENGETITAPFDGEITAVKVTSASSVSEGTILLRIENEDGFVSPITRGNGTTVETTSSEATTETANSSSQTSETQNEAGTQDTATVGATETTSAIEGETTTQSGGNSSGGSGLIVDTVNVKEGQTVNKGATLMTFTDGSVLQAPAKGMITSLAVDSGDSVQSSATVAHITDYTALETTISVDELDITDIKEGQSVEVTASAFPDEKFEGTVTEVASEGTSSNGVSTFDVTVQITDPKNLKVGMSTEASIEVESKQGALYIPVEAVYESGDEKYVLVPTSSSDSSQSTKKVTVETGISNDTSVEITKGLSEGATVQIPKVSSNQTSSQDEKAMMKGGFGDESGGGMSGNPGQAPNGGPSSAGGRGQGGGQ